MKSLTLNTQSEAESHALGVAIGKRLRVHDFIGLTGQLGAGKTLLSRGIAEGAGIPVGEVSSPTYSIVQTYRGTHLVLHHADLYRLTNEADLYATGYYDLLETDSAFLVEWINHIPEAAPEDAVMLIIEVNDTARSFQFTATGPNSEQLLSALNEWSTSDLRG